MKLTWQDCIKVIVSILVIYLGIYYWESISGIFKVIIEASKPILLGLVIAYILNILMCTYEKYYFKNSNQTWVNKTRRAVCMTLAILTLIGIVALVALIVIPELMLCLELLISGIPPIIEDIVQHEFIRNTLPEDILSNLSTINWEEMISKFFSYFTSGLGSAVDTVISTVSTVSSFIVTFFISVIFSIYFLLSKEELQNQSLILMDLYLPKDVNKNSLHVLKVLNECFHRYTVGQCLEAVILGGLCIVGMLIFQFPYAMMIGTLIGFTALIPVAGAYIGAGVGAIMILTVSPVKALLFLVFIVVLQQLEGNLIYPKVVGKSLGLPAVWVLAAVTIGGGIMGIMGMLVGVPLTATIYRLIVEDVNKRRAKA